MKNDESSHELENNTNDFAIKDALYITSYTFFSMGGWYLEFIWRMMKVIMRQKNVNFGGLGGFAPRKFLRI